MDTKEKWLEFLMGALKATGLSLVDYTLANMDKMYFGKRDFLIKTALRLILGQIQSQMVSGKSFDWSRLKIILDLIRNR